MLYPYATFPGHLIITFSQVLKDSNQEGGEKIFVHFEQPDDEMVFKEARYSLPDHKLIYNEGFLPDEQKRNEKILKNNAELIMKFAKKGGVKF